MRYKDPKKNRTATHNSIVVLLKKAYRYKDVSEILSEPSEGIIQLNKKLLEHSLEIQPAISFKRPSDFEKFENDINHPHYISLSRFYRLVIKSNESEEKNKKLQNNIKEVMRDFQKCRIVDYVYQEFVPLSPDANATGNNTYEPLQRYRVNDALGIGVNDIDFTEIKEPKYILFDVEESWNLNHEDLNPNIPDPIQGSNKFGVDGKDDHGTAVLGILNAKDNDKGMVGLHHFTKNIRLSSHFIAKGSPHNLADAIMTVLLDDQSKEGDIILIEAAYPNEGSVGAIWPVELYLLDRMAIIAATEMERIVIEPAGNGGHYLGGLPLDLLNVEINDEQNVLINSPELLRLGHDNYVDSGAIFVAAADPSDNLCYWLYSNYGMRIDCFSWGENVATIGFGDLDFGTPGDYDDDYTAGFNGTSSASAIIAGVALIVQEFYAKHNNGQHLTPSEMRACLSWSGNGIPQGDENIYEYIGYMPNLKIIVSKIIAGLSIVPEPIP